MSRNFICYIGNHSHFSPKVLPIILTFGTIYLGKFLTIINILTRYIMYNLIDVLKEFQKMLNQYPDDQKYTLNFFSFFKKLSLVNSKSIPYVELGTILRNEKPIIFYELKRLSDQSHVINVITSVSIDLKEAIEQISKILNSND